jgi:hypothetical protein
MKLKNIPGWFSNYNLFIVKINIIILSMAFITAPVLNSAVKSDLHAANSINENTGYEKINSSKSQNNPSALKYSLELVEGSEAPLIDEKNPGSMGNNHGYECGQVFRGQNKYHMFITERVDTVNSGCDLTRTGHWISTDGIVWTRVGTLQNSIKTPNIPGYATWSPMPVYDKDENRWNIFYVAYEVNNTYGRIIRAYSKVKGIDGLDGPYINSTDTVLSYFDDNKNLWEDKQGTDSFYPFQSGNKWYGFYGGSDAATFWDVGLTEANSLTGHWTRVIDNPVFTYSENPIVVTFENGIKFCVYDDLAHGIIDCHSIGYGYSSDGINWVQKYLSIPMPKWAASIRTPLSFIYEGNDIYIIYFTALTSSSWDGFEKIGRIRVRLVKN